jgi:hypothetical protein
MQEGKLNGIQTFRNFNHPMYGLNIYFEGKLYFEEITQAYENNVKNGPHMIKTSQGVVVL